MSVLLTEAGRGVYYEYYPGPKLAMVLIHGWGMGCRVWDTTVTRLRREGHAVITLDQRGCGRSDKDFDVISIERLAEDVAALVRHCRLPRAVLNGWSLGGAVAVAAAKLLGPACAGVVLTAAASPRTTQAPDFPHGDPPGNMAEKVAALQEDRANFLMALTKAVCTVPQTAAVENWLWSMFMQAGESVDSALLELDPLDQRAALAALTVPVLAIVGGKDSVLSPAAQRTAKDFAKHGKLVEFNNCGHAPFLEDGPRYRSVIVDFLKSLQ